MTSRLYLIDDEVDLLDSVGMLLELEGFQVRTATRARTALERLIAEPVDLIMTDWKMPGMDGLQLCRELRRRPETAQLPIIFSTAHTEPPLELRCYDRYLQKPVELGRIVATIHELLGESHPRTS